MSREEEQRHSSVGTGRELAGKGASTLSSTKDYQYFIQMVVGRSMRNEFCREENRKKDVKREYLCKEKKQGGKDTSQRKSEGFRPEKEIRGSSKNLVQN